MSTISAREFNRDVSAAKRAASEEPVVITDRGEPTHVLMSITQYRRLANHPDSVAELLAMDEDIEFEPALLESVTRAAQW